MFYLEPRLRKNGPSLYDGYDTAVVGSVVAGEPLALVALGDIAAGIEVVLAVAGGTHGHAGGVDGEGMGGHGYGVGVKTIGTLRVVPVKGALGRKGGVAEHQAVVHADGDGGALVDCGEDDIVGQSGGRGKPVVGGAALHHLGHLTKNAGRKGIDGTEQGTRRGVLRGVEDKPTGIGAIGAVAGATEGHGRCHGDGEE